MALQDVTARIAARNDRSVRSTMGATESGRSGPRGKARGEPSKASKDTRIDVAPAHRRGALGWISGPPEGNHGVAGPAKEVMP